MRCRKDALQKIALEASERVISEFCELACRWRSRAGRRCLELSFLRAAGDGYTYPLRSQMAKVELYELG
jgi:hypothetical protein